MELIRRGEPECEEQCECGACENSRSHRAERRARVLDLEPWGRVGAAAEPRGSEPRDCRNGAGDQRGVIAAAPERDLRPTGDRQGRQYRPEAETAERGASPVFLCAQLTPPGRSGAGG
jgi:hypothetical protein